MNIPGWETMGQAKWGQGTFFADSTGDYESTDTSGFGGGSGIYDYSWDWEQFARDTVTILDPLYGSGGILEPVTVIVDPDETIKETYIDPGLKYIEETYVEPITETAETGLIVAGLIALAVLVK